ncbi:Agenet domain-containing protein [Prunus dulcis]|uniref:Agenet domain-containing protein n=1 Tax=Prunus dulcis TaxID=3755 RepID=A0A4Y1R5F2_PRUDU|nr:Agenet domain-containing protein [Prunus dulcis]
MSYEDAMVEAEIEDSAMDIETIIEGSMAVTGISATASTHDQPLSLCIDEMHSVKAIECSSNPAGTAKQQNEDGGAQVGQPHFPFVRNFPLWENIDSMDVFKRFPQKPHFHPLLKCKEVCREGSALGEMALADLEMLGFDVTAVWDRLKELLEMKVKLGQLQNRSQEVDIQITAYSHDRTRNNETISRIDKDIKDLQEKRATLMSIDAAKGSEICKLQSKANAITEGIQSIHCDFEKLDVTAWILNGVFNLNCH